MDEDDDKYAVSSLERSYASDGSLFFEHEHEDDMDNDDPHRLAASSTHHYEGREMPLSRYLQDDQRRHRQQQQRPRHKQLSSRTNRRGAKRKLNPLLCVTAGVDNDEDDDEDDNPLAVPGLQFLQCGAGAAKSCMSPVMKRRKSGAMDLRKSLSMRSQKSGAAAGSKKKGRRWLWGKR